ncbi:MAG: ATP-binding protein [Anaerolineales bacterium]|jgi:SpoVK/Ycf46/Vps4 family AAA+-type ATPase|nr:ATP-binding protein [Anaerolineales bacterium]
MTDLSGPLRASYEKARKRAEEAERRGAFEAAAAAHRQCAELMSQYAAYGVDGSIRSQRLKRAEAHAEAARKLEGSTVNSLRAAARRSQPDTLTGEDDYEGEVMSLIQRSNVHWEDIGGLEQTKADIKSAYGLALARKPKGVKIDAWRNVLLFGPPGTGKTILAAATAGSLDATFFNVKVSSVLSKYFGESTKLISALYTVARRMSPAVIFLDEFEALTPPRGSGESGAERRIVSTLLAELDGLANKEDESFVLTMGATNLPWLIDSAILSRFQKRIYVPLPDAEARRAILEIHLTRRGHKSEVPLAELVQRTDGFAGREIEQLCQTAITHMTTRANPGLLAVVDQGQDAVRNYEIKVLPLSQQDFQVAFEQIRPATKAETLRLYDEWINQVEA